METDEITILKKELFALANKFAVEGYGNVAVRLHSIHNELLNSNSFYSQITKI